VTSRVCRVRPDVPAVARAFDYLVPDDLGPALRVGSIVRIPLHGRRVRGWVVDDDVEPEAAPDRLVALQAVSSAGPPADVVALCEWAARRWAGPVTTFLRAASPPTIVDPRACPEPRSTWHPATAPPAVLGVEAWPDVAVRLVTWAPGDDRRELVRALCAPDGSTLIVVPEPGRAGGVVRALAREGREVRHLHGALADRERSALWDDVRRGAVVVVGGRAATWLPIPDLRAVVVLDESDEALQEERAPTWHARDLALERARRAGAPATLVSPVPSVDAHHAADVALAPRLAVLRAGWPRVSVVDMRTEPPGSGLCSEALGPAIHGALDRGGRVVCVVNRRGRARISVCRACAAVARCSECGAAVAQPDHDLHCPRCGVTRPVVCAECGSTRLRPLRPGVHAARDDLAALVARATVVDVDAQTAAIGDAEIVVGTEAVLHRVPRGAKPPVLLVAFLAFDEELLAPRARAHDQALWLLVRGARLLGARRDGGCLFIQTRLPEHPVLHVASTGDPTGFVAEEDALRRALAFPPYGAIAEVSGATEAVAVAADALRAASLTVVGGSAGRALVRAASTDALADGFARADLGAARGAGRLRVSVYPPRV
jgi:primosomal protein N' (replication factor Y)